MPMWQAALLLYVPATLVVAGVGVLAWRRRHLTTAATALAATMAALTVWGGVTATSDFVPAWRAALLPFVVPAAAFAVTGFLALSSATADHTWRPGRRWLRLAAIEPLLTVVAASTNDWHGGIVTFDGERSWNGMFWAHTAYCYVVLTVGAVRLFRARRLVIGWYARQIDMLLLAGSFCGAGNIAAIWAQENGHYYDLTMLGFVGTGLMDAWALLRRGVFTMVPVARSLVLDTITDAVVVTDRRRRIVDINPAGERMLRAALPGAPAQLAGLDVSQVVLDVLGEEISGSGEYRVTVDGRRRELDLRTEPLLDRRGRYLGRVVVLRDVTEQNERRRELHAANDRLVDQLETIERLQAELFEQATRDALTGLHNRRHLVEVLDQEVDTALAEELPLAVAMVDLDHFKRINDRHGHAVGDRVLVRAATELTARIGPVGTVARYGGEEFVVVLPGMDAATAAALVDEVRAYFAGVRVAGRAGEVGTTFSAGVAQLAPGGTVDGLLEAADAALYAAKAAGRDRVEVAPVRPTVADASGGPGV